MWPPKKPRVDAEPTPSTLATLPQTLQRRVLSYVAPDDCLVDTGKQKYEVKHDELATISQVSKAWHAIADEAASARVLQVFYVPHTRPVIIFQSRRRKRPRRRSELMALRQQLILRRAHTERLVIDEPRDYGTIGFQLWSAALSHTPKLKALELATIATMNLDDRPTDRIADIVRAATRQCPALKKLSIPEELRPPQKDGDRADGQYMHTLLNAVYDGLKVWSAHSEGLRYLEVPLHNISKDAEAYVGNIIAYCPQIQTHVLATVPLYHYSYEDRIGEDAWKLDLETWDRFCRVCSQLQEISWRNLPFATHFFEIFGNHEKPKLRSLSLVASENWVWKKYFEVVGKTTQTTVKATGFGNTARNAESVLRAAPNLEILDIKWMDAIGGDVPPAMDPDIFGDAFFEALATLCKNLKRLTYDIIPRRTPPRVTTFTDRSMRALATLPHLESVDIIAVNITGDGLFDLVTHHAADSRHQREYILSLGDLVANTSSMLFYDVLEVFLERLASKNGEIPCAKRRVSLQLTNRSSKALEEGENAVCLGKIRHLAQQVRKLHPSLQLRGLVRGYDEACRTMKRMVEFGFATEPAKMPGWKAARFSDDMVDVPIDDVFVHRIILNDAGLYDDTDSD